MVDAVRVGRASGRSGMASHHLLGEVQLARPDLLERWPPPPSLGRVPEGTLSTIGTERRRVTVHRADAGARTGVAGYSVSVSGRLRIAVCSMCTLVGACVGRSPWFNEYYLCEDLAQESNCDGKDCVTVMCTSEYHIGCEDNGFAFARVEPDVVAKFAEECLGGPRTMWAEQWADGCGSAPDDAGASGADSGSGSDADAGGVDSGGADAYGVQVEWDVQVACLERSAL